MDPIRLNEILKEAKRHSCFVISLYQLQLVGNRHFLHEHPASAMGWKEKCIEELCQDPRVHSVVCDQCQFGLVTKGNKRGQLMPAMKPTRFVSSSRHMLECLDKRCDRSHQHRHLTGGRCKDAAFYPLPLVKAILRGIRCTADAEAHCKEERAFHTAVINALKEGNSSDEKGDVVVEVPTCWVKRVKGGKLQIHFEDCNVRRQCVDGCTGEVLHRDRAKAAMIKALTDFCEKHVWKLEEVADMMRIKDHVLARPR